MKWVAASLSLLSLIAAASLQAQSTRVKIFVVSATDRDFQWFSSFSEWVDGLGAGVGLEYRYDRLRVNLEALVVPLESEFGPELRGFEPPTASYSVHQIDLRAGFRVLPILTLEAGAARRYLNPDFLGEEVGWLRLGLSSETRLNSLSAIWARAAYNFPRLSGGGDVGLAAEIGFGASLSTANGRFKGFVGYDFQRINRFVPLEGIFDIRFEMPLQFAQLRMGVSLKP